VATAQPPREPPSGTEGYAEAAGALFRSFEGVAFADVHRTILPLLPTSPARILDVGAGSGRDAAALAAMGHRVVAVEPVAELRARAAAAHPSPRIEWLDDVLPELPRLSGSPDRFDLVMLTGVWMHLDPAQRARAMPAVARLVAAGGAAIMTLRHGPVPAGRRMFDASADETVALAARAGLEVTLRLEGQPSAYARADVTWTRLAFSRPPASGRG
jgi:SAM-dependent methyltransferase